MHTATSRRILQRSPTPSYVNMRRVRMRKNRWSRSWHPLPASFAAVPDQPLSSQAPKTHCVATDASGEADQPCLADLKRLLRFDTETSIHQLCPETCPQCFFLRCCRPRTLKGGNACRAAVETALAVAEVWMCNPWHAEQFAVRGEKGEKGEKSEKSEKSENSRRWVVSSDYTHLIDCKSGATGIWKMENGKSLHPASRIMLLFTSCRDIFYTGHLLSLQALQSVKPWCLVWQLPSYLCRFLRSGPARLHHTPDQSYRTEPAKQHPATRCRCPTKLFCGYLPFVLDTGRRGMWLVLP